MTTRATFRHAWRALYRNLTLVDVKGVPFSLDRVVYETLVALSDVARRLAKAHVTAYCRWGGEEDSRPKLHKAASLFITVDFVSTHPDAQITLKPGLATALQIAKGRGPTRPPPKGSGSPGPHPRGRVRPNPHLGSPTGLHLRQPPRAVV